jgi:hypothetical protein
VFSLCFYCKKIYFLYISHVYQNIHVPYILHEMHSFACCFHVFALCFYCRNIFFWYILHVYTKIHMYPIFYMNCTVLLVFSCVFTVFSLQKHVLFVHFTCIHEMQSFANVFMCFHCVFPAETRTFGTFHMYTKIHISDIF